MSENRSRSVRDFSKYDEMKTEDLEQILRSDADAPEGTEPDVELLLYVMEVLADRRRNNNEFTGKTALEAFESFKKNYLPEEISKESVPEARKTAIRTVRWLRGAYGCGSCAGLCVPGLCDGKCLWVEYLEGCGCVGTGNVPFGE